MMYLWPAWASNQKSNWLLLIMPARRRAEFPGASRNRVMLWAGSVLLKLFPRKLTGVGCAMVLAEASCHIWAVPLDRKFERFMVTSALAVSCLLITIAVSAPSDDRKAAKVETL